VRQAGWSALWSRLANVSLKQQWCETGLAGAASGGMHGLQMDCATYNLTDRVARPFQLPYTEAVDNCNVFGSPFCNVTRLSGNPIPLKGFVDMGCNPLPWTGIPPYRSPNPAFSNRNQIDTDASPLSSPTAAARCRWAPQSIPALQW
jgi:hypothetical protein